MLTVVPEAELEVQKFLRRGGTLAELKELYAINFRVSESLGVVTLNYNQIMSQMGNPIVQECRALVLELGTWRVKSWFAPKFFNLGEGHTPKDFDWSNFVTLEKLDGSLIYFWYHDSEGWLCGTRSVPDASTGVDDSGLTFRQLVVRTITEMGTTWNQFTAKMEPGYTYSLELMAPENQIVCDYGGTRRLVLIGIRHLQTLREIDIHEWHDRNAPPFPVVQRYPGFTLDAVKKEVQVRDPRQHEGYVLIDPHFHRIKIKSESYVFMSSRRDALGKSNKARIALIQADAVDDVLPNLPEFVQARILHLQRELVALVKTCDALYATVATEESDKDFALKVQHSGYSPILFAIRKGKRTDAWDYFKNATPKRVLEYLDEEDDEAEVVE